MATDQQQTLPSAEAALFDRSERLWGAESQKRLRAGHVVVLGATPAACETLKNLVLPGLGSFVVVDDKTVAKVDLGSNFFLEATDEGRNRAEATAAILAELNPLCKGSADVRSIHAFVAHLAAAKDSLANTVVIASGDVNRADLVTLSETAAARGFAIVRVLSNGLNGVLRLQAPDYFVFSTMPGPDVQIVDLRPLNPFPELRNFMMRLDPRDASLEPEVHAHIPWFVVLFHAIQRWREKEGSQDRPRNSKEWAAVKAIISEEFTRVDPNTGFRKMHESFSEACTWCSERVDLTKRNVPELRAVLNDPRAVSPTKDLGAPWFLAHGLRRFKEAHQGYNPLMPKIPDFDATTDMYKELQAIFRRQAAADAAELWGYANEASAAVGGPSISNADAAEFAAQSWEVNFVSYPTIAAELSTQVKDSAFSNSWAQEFRYYVAYRASLLFHAKHGHYPGFRATPESAAGTPQADLDELCAIVSSEWPEAPLDEMKSAELLEWVRGGGCEIVTTSAILGAVAGQEAIKLLQRMRRPMIHTLIYNGVTTSFTTVGPA